MNIYFFDILGFGIHIEILVKSRIYRPEIVLEMQSLETIGRRYTIVN